MCGQQFGCAVVVALSLLAQVVDEVPNEENDIVLDEVITVRDHFFR